MKKSILFLLGDANICGGTYVIFQHALHLQKMGYDVTIALVYMNKEKFFSLKHSDRNWHHAINELRFITINEAKEFHFDVAIFTWWATVFFLEHLNASTFIYFVQSIESRFYHREDLFMQELADHSYELGLPVITEATWIQQHLQKHYNNNCILVKNGILKSLYTADGPRIAEKPTDKLRVLVEGPVHSHFKNVKKSVELCLKANVGEVWLLTSSPIKEYPSVDRLFSHVAITDVPAIYRSCHVIVKLSYVEGMFGPPLEMFHCGGTAIVYDVTGHDEYIKHNENALVAKTDDDETVIEYLRKLNTDKELLARLTKGALDTASQWINWETSSTQFAEAVDKFSSIQLTEHQKSVMLDASRKHFRESITITITKNNETIEKQIIAEPILESTGYYVLAIPMFTGPVTIGVNFGKSYQRVGLIMADILGTENTKPEGTMETQILHMTQDPEKTYTCDSEKATLVINTNLQNKSNSPKTVFCLRLVFRPVARQKITRPTTHVF